ncbi:MAG: GIY-YIG nuclease family protein [Bacilli bacterium]
MTDIFDNYAHQRPESTPIIYAYSDTRFPNCLKVGYTARDISIRMKEHYPTITPKQSYEVKVIESAMYPDGGTFTDYDVHRVLKQKHIECVGGEWYKCGVNDVKAAIVDVMTRKIHKENRTLTFKMRPEQERAVSVTKQYFENEILENKNPPKFLWNAKMRFGKTFASYQLAKAMNMKKILILTFKPAVEMAWEEDLNLHVDFEGWQFLHKKSPYLPEELDPNKPIVCFGSFQDFLGTNELGGIKAKNEWVHTTHWDLVIFDEYHFGAWRENAKKLFEQDDDDENEFDIEKYSNEEAPNAYNESFLPITTNFYLFLSGTPFRALNSGEFTEDQIFNWTYGDEQKAKEEWTGKPEMNPYLSLPKMVLLTYQMPQEISRIARNGEYNEFDLNVFFKAETLNDNLADSQFIYKSFVQKWLDLIRGQYRVVDDLKLGIYKKPVMPYSDVRMISLLNHTLWFLPTVASCFAMKNLINEKNNIFYQEYTINVCAGKDAGIGIDAIGPVMQSMKEPLKSKTITLTCGKLTTGVTIKPWTGIFMLRNISTPETYFQSAFRVQSPWLIENEFGVKENLKKECYVFDFALDRALKQISDYSCGLDVNESNPEKKVQEFINFLPVLAYDGSTMKEINATDILDITTAGTSATLLARKWQSALLVNVNNEILEKLMHNEQAMKALMNIEGFRSVNQDIETIINKSNLVKNAKSKMENVDKHTKKVISEAEKEYKSKRAKIQEKLIKFATRIPIFMYLTDCRENSLKDVITQIETKLFKSVTGLNIDDFKLLVSIGVFNDSVMNEAVYKFKRYEDSSLSYTGKDMHLNDSKVGLFSTVISKEDYLEMTKQQKESMFDNKNTKVKIDNGNTIQITKQEFNENGKGLNNKKNSKPIALIKGDKIEHKIFGVGYVVSSEGEIFIAKFNVGTKKFKNPYVFEYGFLKKCE